MRIVAMSALLLATWATAHAQQPVGPTGSAACPYGLKAGPGPMECATPGHPFKDGYYHPPPAPPPHRPTVWNEICGASGVIRYGCKAPPSAPPPLTRGGDRNHSDLKEIQGRAYRTCMENPQIYPYGHCGTPP
jgi:hypothetical protein